MEENQNRKVANEIQKEVEDVEMDNAMEIKMAHEVDINKISRAATLRCVRFLGLHFLSWLLSPFVCYRCYLL